MIRIIKRKKLLRLWYLTCRYFLVFFDDESFMNIIIYINYFRLKKKYYVLNLKNPKTFNEKINFMKLKNKDQKKQRLVDKYLAREYVKNIIGEKYLVPLIGVFNNAEEIDLSKLPSEFVLKTNHGSGWNFICKDKTKINNCQLEKSKKNIFSKRFNYAGHHQPNSITY